MKREKEPLIWSLLFTYTQLNFFPKMCSTTKYRVLFRTSWITELNSFPHTMIFSNSAILGLSSLGKVEIIKTFYSFNTENSILVSNYNSEFRVFNCIHSKLQVNTSSTVLRLCPYSYLQTTMNLLLCKIQTKEMEFSIKDITVIFIIIPRRK